MKVLLQRVSSAGVVVDGEEVAAVGSGLLALVGFTHGDGADVVARLAAQVAALRVFPDERGRLHRCVVDTGGAVLAVPQFTLYADTARGRRPDFTRAMEPGAAAVLFADFVRALGEAGVHHVRSGVFGAHMSVRLVNDGPVTIMLER